MRPGISLVLETACMMNVQLLFALLCAPLAAAAEPAVRPEIRRLLPEEFWLPDPADRIDLGGSAIGGAAAPSGFYLAAVEALDKGGAGNREFMEMTRHPYLCVRGVGMAGLAREGAEFGIRRLRELLASREGETGMPGGCGEARLYESAIAWHFLTGTGYLCCRRTTPLFGEKEALSLTLETLCRDDWAGAREPSWRGQEISAPALFVVDRISSGKLALRMECLRAAAPEIKMHELVKAVGRLPAGPQVKVQIDPFWMGACEVTCGEMVLVCKI